jgi:hypothetical protein
MQRRAPGRGPLAQSTHTHTHTHTRTRARAHTHTPSHASLAHCRRCSALPCRLARPRRCELQLRAHEARHREGHKIRTLSTQTLMPRRPRIGNRIPRFGGGFPDSRLAGNRESGNGPFPDSAGNRESAGVPGAARRARGFPGLPEAEAEAEGFDASGLSGSVVHNLNGDLKFRGPHSQYSLADRRGGGLVWS